MREHGKIHQMHDVEGGATGACMFILVTFTMISAVERQLGQANLNCQVQTCSHGPRWQQMYNITSGICMLGFKRCACQVPSFFYKHHGKTGRRLL